MGINSTLRTLAQSAGPSITGVLAGNDAFWAAFVMAGALKGSYDVGLWVWGLKVKLHEHEKPVVKQAKRQGEGDEEEGRS